jgi:carbamoyl-phosphate synthase large subunit
LKPVSVTVSGAGSLFGQGIIKCLRMEQAGLDLVINGLDYFETAIGFHWCDSRALLPDYLSPTQSEDEWFDCLCKELIKTSSQFLFVGVDFELAPISRRKSELFDRTGCTAIVSPEEVIRICKDKFETASYLLEAGLNAPRSWLPDQFDLAIESEGFPLLIKPRFGSRSRGISIVHDQNQMTQALKGCEQPVIQEFLPDDDQEFSCGIVWLEGKVDSFCSLRRQLKDGNTSIAYSEKPPIIEEYCAEIVENLKPFGPLNIQLRIKDDKPYAFEINPRFSGTTIFRAHLGINEPLRLLSNLCGISTPSNPPQHRGQITRYFDELVELQGPNESDLRVG